MTLGYIGFLKQDKTPILREKTDKFDYIKTKNFYLSKNNIEREDKPQTWRRYLQHI